MAEILELEQIKEMGKRIENLRGYLDIDARKEECSQLESATTANEFWSDTRNAKSVLKRIKELKKHIDAWEHVHTEFTDIFELYEISLEDNDTDSLEQLSDNARKIGHEIDKLEFLRKLGGEDDDCPAVLSIHSGAGGTESCDWCEMLFRMYCRWLERKGFEYTILDSLPGDEAGLKSVTMEIRGDYVYGHLKAESGVHRLVRISPFDSNSRRHTSFASVYSYPLIEEADDIALEESEIRVDTYRASGAGGQHINKTDSAVRMTHVPTGIVVQCQNERSQIKNRATALRILKARVRQHFKEEEEKQRLEKLAKKKKIEWGSQIRSYVLHPYNMVKDHRTNTETSNTAAVLDGDIDMFIESYLLEYE
ncbi:MAG: peptide chain release factor 2 [Chitinivibrionales bacterium]|nr:peptide chain release factor 2 [Chitinivibrionales bacterium]